MADFSPPNRGFVPALTTQEEIVLMPFGLRNEVMHTDYHFLCKPQLENLLECSLQYKQPELLLQFLPLV